MNTENESSDDVLERLLVLPYRRLAEWHIEQSKKTWFPWRRIRHESFALGLVAAIDLIHSYKNKLDQENDST